jgi:hypothetical protein
VVGLSPMSPFTLASQSCLLQNPAAVALAASSLGPPSRGLVEEIDGKGAVVPTEDRVTGGGVLVSDGAAIRKG